MSSTSPADGSGEFPHDGTLGSSAASSLKGGRVGDSEDGDLPTEEERRTLRLVADKIPIAAALIAVVEFG